MTSASVTVADGRLQEVLCVQRGRASAGLAANHLFRMP